MAGSVPVGTYTAQIFATGDGHVHYVTVAVAVSIPTSMAEVQSDVQRFEQASYGSQAGVLPPEHLDIPRSYLSTGSGKFVSEKVGELFGEAVGGATS